MKIFFRRHWLPVALVWNLISLTSGSPAMGGPPLAETPNKTQFWIAQQAVPTSLDFSSFFETGRLRSQDRLLFQKPPRDVIPITENSNSWQFIIFKAGGCSFWMPPGVITEEKIVLDTKVGQLSFRTLASNSEDSRYVVGYAESLTDEQVQNPQLLLEAISNKAVPPEQFQMTGKDSVILDGHTGQELTFEDAKEAITIRFYLVGERVYALGARHPKNEAEPRKTRAFLNALQLIGQ